MFNVDILEEEEEREESPFAVDIQVGPQPTGDGMLPQRRVTPGDVAQSDAVQRGSRLKRWGGSFARTIWEGARSMRPFGIRGLSRQDEGVAGLGAQFMGEQESLLNIRSSDGRKLSYAEGTPEYDLQRQFQGVQSKGDDIYKFLETPETQAYMKKHKLKALRFGVDIGAVSLFPGLADTFGTFGESAGLALNKLFGTQLFGNAENARAMWSGIADTFSIHTPEGRQAFLTALDDDPAQVLADAAMLMMLKGKAAGGVGRGAVAAGQLAKANARRNLVRSGVQLQRLDRVLNEGFRVPGLEARPLLSNTRGFLTERDAVGRMRTRFGLSEAIDPEEWGARTAVELPQQIASSTLSPFSDYFEPTYRDRLKEMGIDPSRTIASLQSRSQVVATKEAKREQSDDEGTIEGIETAVLGIETKINEILAETHESGDIAEAGKAISEAYEGFVNQIRTEARKGYDQETPERKQFIMSLRNTFAELYGEQGIVEESKALEGSVGFSDFSENRILKGFDETMERIQQTGEAGITPEFVEGTEPTQAPLQGGERKQAGVDLDAVVGANRQGTARRIAFAPTQESHAVEYDVAPLDRLVASHTIDGQVNPLYTKLVEALGAGTLQTLGIQRSEGAEHCV